jgi:hypothetical protein
LHETIFSNIKYLTVLIFTTPLSILARLSDFVAIIKISIVLSTCGIFFKKKTFLILMLFLLKNFLEYNKFFSLLSMTNILHKNFKVEIDWICHLPILPAPTIIIIGN